MQITIHRSLSLLSSLLFVVTFAGVGAREVGAQEAAPRPVAEELFSRILHDVDGRQVAVTKLVYAPGVASMPHRHQAYLAVYVVSGQVESALDDEAPVLYGPGDAWYESHNQLHRVFRNPSATEPFIAIVFALRDPDHPAVRAPEAERH